MNVLTIVTGYNTPGKHDATGAFLPEARAFLGLHCRTVATDGHANPEGGWLEYVSPQTPAKRRFLAETTIRGMPGLDILAAFGHGTARSLIVTGHKTANIASFADSIRTSGAKTVVLYACSTALGREGFADRLADLLPGVNVWAHTAAGHTTWNPNTELAGGPRRGDPIARPGDPLWKRWRERMATDQAFRLSFWLGAVGLDRSAALEVVRAAV